MNNQKKPVNLCEIGELQFPLVIVICEIVINACKLKPLKHKKPIAVHDGGIKKGRKRVSICSRTVLIIEALRPAQEFLSFTRKLRLANNKMCRTVCVLHFMNLKFQIFKLMKKFKF